MEKLGISLELSDSKNKNGVAIVDRAKQELEKEIATLSPENKPLSSSELAKATIALNSRIRNRSLSSYEIMFCREQNTGDNIPIDDKSMAATKKMLKEENHKFSERSKFPKSKEPSKANAEKGDFVFLKEDGSKHQLRDLYLVVKIEEDNVTLMKMLHSLNKNEGTKISSKTIVVSQNEIYKSTIYNNEKFKTIQCEDEKCFPLDVVHDDSLEQETKTKKWSPFVQEELISSDSDSDDSESTFNDAIEDSSIASTDDPRSLREAFKKKNRSKFGFYQTRGGYPQTKPIFFFFLRNLVRLTD